MPIDLKSDKYNFNTHLDRPDLILYLVKKDFEAYGGKQKITIRKLFGSGSTVFNTLSFLFAGIHTILFQKNPRTIRVSEFCEFMNISAWSSFCKPRYRYLLYILEKVPEEEVLDDLKRMENKMADLATKAEMNEIASFCVELFCVINSRKHF